jgi:hypothetical protein
MRPRASHPGPHSYVDSCAALSPRGGGMTASARQRSRSFEQRVQRLLKPVTDSSSRDHEPATAAVANGSFLPMLRRATNRTGDEAAKPGQPVALARVSGASPGDSLARISGSTGTAAIIRQAQELSRFAEPTLRQIVAPRNTKKYSPCEEPVDDVSSLWKPEENWRRIAGMP